MARPVEFRFNDLENYSENFSNLLGAGGFADVYRATIPDDNVYLLRKQEVVIKKAKNVDANNKEIQELQLQNEKNALSRISHPNIIKLVGYCFTSENQCLVLEYASRGTLTNNLEGLDWEKTMMILKKLGQALHYIHTLPGGYFHGDIKCDNVLLMEDYEPKLSDFGTFILEVDSVDTILSQVNTIGYVDPERSNRPDIRPSQSDDVYAFGVILLQMLFKCDAPMIDTPGGVKHIREWAIEEKKLGINKKLPETGCSRKSANSICRLALELTRISRKVDDSSRQRHWNTLRDSFEDSGAVVTQPSTSNANQEYITRPNMGEVLSQLETLKISKITLKSLFSKLF